MVNKVRTIDFLPEIFRTDTNKQFLAASLDVITSQPDLKRVQGFIGEKYGYGVEPTDRYVVEPSKSRRDYQLDPGVIFLKPDTQAAKDFINYPGIINALEHEGAEVSNADRLFNSQFYSWDPFVDYDKIVNYSQYYWIPKGPDSVIVSTNLVYESAEYTVSSDDNGYRFTQLAELNPEITLLRGGTYTFVVPGDSGFANFWLQTVPGIQATVLERTISGVTNNGTNSGTITFTVPPKSTLLNDVIYYQSATDELSVGSLNLIESNTANTIDVDQILGRKNYTSPNGVPFVNGLKVQFQGNVTPASYQDGEYYVDGVGSNIVLLQVENYIASEVSGEAIYNSWDESAWDVDRWEIELYIPVSPEYITVNRNSRDLNAWTRANRWFHQDVLDITTANLGYVTAANSNDVTRAQRPVVEYRGNLKLFNSGSLSLGPIDILDTVTTDAFSNIQGKTVSQIGNIDGQLLVNGTRIVFTADTDYTVRENVYIVSLVPAGPYGDDIVALNVDTSVTVINDCQIFVIGGSSQAGTTWRYDSSSQRWIAAQRKTTLNQYPLYDIFNTNDVSLGNGEYYSGTNFAGSKLFSYTVGTGSADPVLGFPISYSGPGTIGDIQFTVNLNTDVFSYNISGDVETSSNVNIGFVHNYVTNEVIENLSGWVTAVGPSFQYQVFEFPINTTYTSEFICDVPASTTTPWSNIVVYLNDNILDKNDYVVTIDTVKSTTTVILGSDIGDKVTILVISDSVSKTAYYQTPNNLENNPFNTNITTVAVGDMRNQYRSIFTNAPGVTGSLFGNNNIHNLGNLNNYGIAISQNSASLVLPGVFLRKPEVNIFNSIQFNSDQYYIYKTLLVDLAASSNYSIYQTPSGILDDIIYKIGSTRTSTSAFFWSDMIFSGNPYLSNSYSFGADTSTATFSLGRIYDFSSANFFGLGIYLTRILPGNIETTIQLIRGVDYVVSADSPSVVVNYEILSGDSITVKEYNQTYGNYCPNTPSKLGLYPAFIPGVILDYTYSTPTYFVRGHDGSYNKLYGNYDPATQQLDDFRDVVLLEFEKRVFNNIKGSGIIPLTADDIMPGEFRTTEYTQPEILDIYSTTFLNWVGANRIDFKSQYYSVSNKFTYNYNQSSDKLTNSALLQGYWRGIYNWLYDSDNPADAPWELLGLVDKPTWWDIHYGAAPYTSDNTYMWTDIANGYVWNDGAPYVNPKKIRPSLLEILPVDSLGNLVSPFISVVGNYNKLTFNRDWRVGDGAPAEASYLNSSTWPFDLMRLMALTKPAKFFNLFVDRDRYQYDAAFDQYLYDERYHLDPRSVEIYGNGVSKNSYINWVVDYINQKGADGTAIVTSLLANLDVRLIYNLAGFSAKNYLKFLVEKATPNSKNSSLLIPDESYSILLYDNPPEETITYSSVIIQKATNGWTVWGNSKNKQYFSILEPKPGYYQTITSGAVSIKVSKEFYPDRITDVPYGTLFHGTQALGEFLRSYGRYLTQQGVVFDNIINGVVYDWDRITQEFLAWSQQGWSVGSIISVNPSAKLFTVDRPGLVVQPMTIQDENFILNQNLLPVQSQDAGIERTNELFKVKILNDGDSVSYTNLNLNSIEHAIVFDNTTVFNDVIYNLVTGLRQPRLLMQGYKSGDWNGFVTANGYILNEDNVKEWRPNTKYPKNIIVIYKSKYYTALKLIEAAAEFSKEDWLVTDYDQIKTGLLPNPSTNAYESQYYYDSNRANLENDVDLLAFSLIGFRPRDYLTAADLSDITQINVYKNIVKGKGTTELANSFKGAEFDQGAIDYSIQENWAIRAGEFGSILNRNFIECVLEQSTLKGNPTLIGFNETGESIPGVQQTIAISNLINFERPPLSPYFLPQDNTSYTVESGLPSAGYVNLGDCKFQEYSFQDLNDDSTNIDNLYNNDVIWLANHKNSWGVFSATSLNIQVLRVDNNLNGTVLVTFSGAHNLSANDLVAIANFDFRVNGFYTVTAVQSINSILLTLVLDPTVNVVNGAGVIFELVTRRFEQPSDAASSTLLNTEWNDRKIWADYDVDHQWAVWAASPVFKVDQTYTDVGNFGTSVAYTSLIGKLIADGAGNLYRFWGSGDTQTLTGGTGTGTQVLAFNEYAYCSSPDENLVYVYELDTENDLLNLVETINLFGILGTNTGAIAVGTDRQWLYVADSTAQEIAMFSYDDSANQYAYADLITDATVPASSSWGSCLATSTDGVKLIVGAPNEDIMGVLDAGAAYAYSRRIQRFYADGITSSFTLANASPLDKVDVYVNDVLQTTTVAVSGTSVIFTAAPGAGSVIEVSTGYIDFVQRFESDNIHTGALFGNSVDTNRYGAEVVIGAPYEISNISDVNGVEGAVYRYTNGGQRYGVINSAVSGTQTGTMFVDGYQVNYSGTIDQISQDINSQTPTNIIASYSGNLLTITVKENTPEVLYNIIDVTGVSTDLLNLGIVPYANTQLIYNLNLSDVSAFGFNVKMNERDSLLVSAPVDVRRSPTTFDYTPNCNQDDTIFDNDSTIFIDSFSNQGVVYEYDYLPAVNENMDNPGKYAFGQYISTALISSTVPQPKFGSSLAYAQGVILAGTTTWNTLGGGVSSYTTSWTPTYECEVIKPTAWYLDKKPLPIVDINAINNISIYDVRSNSTLDYLDYIDPLQGKILGAVHTNLDHLSTADPAVYSVNGVSWLWDHVGDTWLDLTTIRLLNYHQPDLAYNSKNWGKAFPGSLASVYTWVESTEAPLNYSGAGFPVVYDQFNSATSLDETTNSLITKYYFWVKNYDQIPQGKTLSPLVLSTYLLNPINSGISYLAPMTTNVVALYNSGGNIQSNSSALHLGYGLIGGLDEKHTSWSLIRDGNEEDFLSGLPTVLGKEPTGLYLKFLESFSGFDNADQQVPDTRLPILLQFGTAVRPRQSMFINRLLALNNYLTYANNILIQYPIVETKDLSYLQTAGATFDTRAYWRYVDWWAQGYSSSTKPVMEVSYVTDLQTIISGEILTGIGGISIMLEDGLVVKVSNNNFGNAEYYVFNTATGWTRIGLENGTVQLSSALWSNAYGWSSEYWGSVWDKSPYREITWVVRWLVEQCYTGDLAIERNASLILMFNYIQSESLEQNNYLPWLNKTSLVDVSHKIRSLLPYKKYQRDNQEFLEGYLNEIKPYHVLIKDFVFTYDGIDTYSGTLTDFDLPAKYNSSTGKFSTPQLVYQTSYTADQYTPDNLIWTEQDYAQWFSNYGISISNNNVEFYPVTVLVSSLTEYSTNAEVKSVYGLPTTGSIIIDDEVLNYNSLNYITNTILGLTRGIDNTTAAAHAANSTVNANMPAVIVHTRGRGYAEPPEVTAYIDTAVYPEPSDPAVLAPIMAGDKVIGITVINSGSGYATTPVIQIAPSSIASTFASTAFNTVTNVITIVGHDFQDGDSVIYTVDSGTTAPDGLSVGGYYYVRVISANEIALYYSYRAASVYNLKTTASDTARIEFKNSGSGTGNILSVAAQASCFTTSQPVREFDIQMKFNRITYDTVVTDWESETAYTADTSLVMYQNILYRCLTSNSDVVFDYDNWQAVDSDDAELTAADRVYAFYRPTASMPGIDFSQLMTGMEYPNAMFTTPVFNTGWDYAFWDDLIVGYDASDPDPDVDTVLTSPSFPEDISTTSYDVSGGEFLDGYGPEELVPGIVYDSLNFSVTGNYPDSPNPDIPVNFRIYVNKYGIMTVYNTNPYTQTTLAQDFTDGDTTMYFTDVTAVLDLVPYGIVYVNGEYIGFTSSDLGTNSITGLHRGLFGTITNTFVASGATAQSVLIRDRLGVQYTDQWWYGSPVLPSANTTLEDNTYAAAVFLQQQTP